MQLRDLDDYHLASIEYLSIRQRRETPASPGITSRKHWISTGEKQFLFGLLSKKPMGHFMPSSDALSYIKV